MAFNINAAVVLSGPKNISKVRNSIKKQLSTVTVPVKLVVDKNSAKGLSQISSQLGTLNASLTKLNSTVKSTSSQLRGLANSGKAVGTAAASVNAGTQKINKSLDKTAKSADIAGNAIESFGKDAALAVRRFAAFSIATGVIFGFTRAVTDATGEAIKFQRELVKITQVTGQSGKQLKGLQNTIDQLATSLGLGANELLDVARTFAQTGQSLGQVEKSLKAVARASLAPTFGEIKQTTEGAIAAINQFGIGADKLESILGSLNQVSKKFAVESEDLISVIRRAGGVFAASSDQLGKPEERLRELIGIFTAVRSTTRESADTIATGLRTIFTRVQRPRTIEFLKQFGVQLRATTQDAKNLGIAEGEFVGIFEALRRISKASKGLDTLQIASLVEELGGVRQVGKLLPALRNFEKAEKAVQVALEGRESITKDVALATQTLSVQIEQLQQNFNKLIRDISQSEGFQSLAKTAIVAANAFITLADTLRPILPALTAIAAVKISRGIFDFSRGFIGGVKKGGGASGVGAGIAGSVTGGAKDPGAEASKKQLISQLTKNTSAITRNTSELTKLSSGINLLQKSSTTLNTSASNLVSSANGLNATLKALPAQIRAAGSAAGGFTAVSSRGPRRRSKGGTIPKFATGGFVKGPSHAQGGVVAELEGGEFVVPKKDARKELFIGGLAQAASKRVTSGGNLGRSGDLFKPGVGGLGIEVTKGFSQFFGGKDGLPGKGGATARFAKLPPAAQAKLAKDYRRQQKGKGAVNKTKPVVGADFILNPGQFGGLFLVPPEKEDGSVNLGTRGNTVTGQGAGPIATAATTALKAQGFTNAKIPAGKVRLKGRASQFIASENDIRSGIDKETRDAAQQGMEKALEASLKSESLKIGDPSTNLSLSESDLRRSIKPLFDNDPEGRVNSAAASIQGYLFEGIIAAIGKLSPQSSGARFDFIFEGVKGVSTEGLADFFGADAKVIKRLAAADAKRSASKGNVQSIFQKTGEYVGRAGLSGPSGTQRYGKFVPSFATGGMVPVAISNNEGLVDPKTAKGNLGALEAARKGIASGISAISDLPIKKVSGPGTGTSDSIKTDLASGTFVLPASTMAALSNRRQNARAGGIVSGFGKTVKENTGTALSIGAGVGLAAASVDTSSSEAFKSSLLNAGLILAFQAREIKEFADEVKKNAAAAKDAKGAVKGSGKSFSKTTLARQTLGSQLGGFNITTDPKALQNASKSQIVATQKALRDRAVGKLETRKSTRATAVKEVEKFNKANKIQTNATKRVVAAQKKTVALDSQKSLLTGQQNALSQKVAGLEAQKATLIAKQNKITAEQTAKQARLTQIQGVGKKAGELTVAQRDLAAARGSGKFSQGQIRALEGNVNRLQNEARVLTRQTTGGGAQKGINSLQASISSLDDQIKPLNKGVNNLGNKIVKLDAESKNLATVITKESNKAQRAGALTKVLRPKATAAVGTFRAADASAKAARSTTIAFTRKAAEEFGRRSAATTAQTGAKGFLGKTGSLLSKGLGGPAGIATLVASLVGDPVVEGISTLAVGKRQTRGGESGFSKEQGGLGQAQLVGGAKGAIQGAAFGASIGLATGPLAPILAPIGAAIGGIIGAITGSEFAKLDQLRFESVLELDSASSGLGKAFKELNEKGIRNVKALDETIKANKAFVDQFSKTQSDLLNLRGSKGLAQTDASFLARGQASIGEALFKGVDVEDTFAGAAEAFADNAGPLVGAAAGAAIGAGIGAFVGGIGAIPGAIIGGTIGLITDIFRNLGSQGRIDARVGASASAARSKNLSTTLDLVPDEVFENAGKTFQALTADLVSQLPADQLSEILALGDSTGLDSLSQTLRDLGPNTESFNKQLELLGTLQTTTGLALVDEFQKRVKEAAPEKPLKRLLDSAAGGGAAFAQTFGKTGSAKQARKAAIDDFIADLNRQRREGFVNESNTIQKRAALGTGQEELSSEQFIKLIRDAQGGNKAARSRLQKVATGIQGTDEDTANNVNNLLKAGGELLNLIDSISDSATKTSKAVSTQLLYNQILERTSRQIDALGAGLDVLSKNLEGAVSQFAQFGEGIRQEIEQILSIQQSVAGTARGNVFERTGVSSRAEIEAGVQRVRRATGQGNAAFGDLTDTIRLGDILPQALKDTLTGFAPGQNVSIPEFKAALEKGLSAQGVDLSTLSTVARDQFNQALENSLSGINRQGGVAGIGAFEAGLKERGGLDQLTQTSQQVAQTFAAVTNSLNKFETEILKIADLQVKTAREAAKVELNILKKRQEFTRRFDKFSVGGPTELSAARGNLQQTLLTQLRAGGAGGTLPITGTGAGDLISRRNTLEERLRSIRSDLGIDASTSPEKRASILTDAAKSPETDKLVKQLSDTTAALEGTKQALDTLSNDTTTLAAIENQLVAVNSQRLTQRQRLQADLQAVSSAKTPKELKAVLDRIRRPAVAAGKIQGGQAISAQEAAAIQSDLLQGSSGVIGTGFRQAAEDRGLSFDEAEKVAQAQVERSLANFQEGGRNAFLPFLGKGLTDARFGRSQAKGGFGATAKGESDVETDLKAQAKSILDIQSNLLKDVGDANLKLINERENLLRNQLELTRQKTIETGDAFTKLRAAQQQFIEDAEIARLELQQGEAKTQAREAQERLDEKGANFAATDKFIQDTRSFIGKRDTRKFADGKGIFSADNPDIKFTEEQLKNREKVSDAQARKLAVNFSFQAAKLLKANSGGADEGTINEATLRVRDVAEAAIAEVQAGGGTWLEAKDAAAEAFAKELTQINKEVKSKALQKDPQLAKDLKTVETTQQKVKEIQGKQTKLEERKNQRLGSAERRKEGIKAFEAGEFDRFGKGAIESLRKGKGREELTGFEESDRILLQEAFDRIEGIDRTRKAAPTAPRTIQSQFGGDLSGAPRVAPPKLTPEARAFAEKNTPQSGFGPELTALQQERLKKLIPKSKPGPTPNFKLTEADRSLVAPRTGFGEDPGLGDSPDTAFVAAARKADKIRAGGGPRGIGQQLEAGLINQQEADLIRGGGGVRNILATKSTENQQGELDKLREIREDSKDFKSFAEAVGPENAQKLLDANKADAARKSKERRDQQAVSRLTDTRQVRDRRTGRVTTVGARNQAKLQQNILTEKGRVSARKTTLASKQKAFDELGGERALGDLQLPLGPLNEEQQKKLEALQAAKGARDSAQSRLTQGEQRLGGLQRQQALIPQSPVGAARQAGQLPPAQNQQRAVRDVNQGVPTQQRQQQQLRQPQQQQQQQTQTADLPTALNTFANSKVGSDLLAAATKMQEINAAGGLKFEWQGTVKPIEVILNGAGLLASLTDDVKDKLTPLIAEEVEKQMKLNIN